MTPTRRAWLNHPQVTLRWLVSIRWASVGLQLLFVIAASVAWPGWLPLAPMLAMVGIGAASNVALALRPARTPRAAETVAGVVMLGDTALFTCLLALSGASSSPFTSIYLVNVALAALLLRPAWTAAVTAASASGFGLLFLVPAGEHAHHGADMSGHLIGMWVAFLAVGPFVAVAVSGIRSALSNADAELEQAREAKDRADRVAGLATLAAGAAHELATPLSVIAVAATEIERAASDADPALRADAQLVRTEVERCRGILAQLSHDAGASMGELGDRITVGELLEHAVRGLPALDQLRVEGDDDLMDLEIVVPSGVLASVLNGLLRNAQLASTDGRPVILEARHEASDLVVEVQDQGVGMTADVLGRARDPFFSTRPAGTGMGLGLFVASSVASQLGGRLELQSEVGRGTTARVVIPLQRGQR